MDLSKAFDSLPHNLIVLKLKEYGADSKTANLIKDYLTNRLQRVKLGDKYSEWYTILKGIPQGSILGPLIFNMFMNDLSNSIQHSILPGYADDTQIFYADKEIAKIEQVINTDLRNADKWDDENGMTRNPAKCQQ